MTDREILEVIENHFLTIRRIPLQRVSLLAGIHRTRYPDAEIVVRQVRRKIDGELRTVNEEYLRIVETPQNAGCYMCQPLANATGSLVKWDVRQHHLAETLEGSIKKFLSTLKND